MAFRMVTYLEPWENDTNVVSAFGYRDPLKVSQAIKFELSTTMDVLICKPSYHGLCYRRVSKFIGGAHITPSMLLLKHQSWELLSCHI